MQIGSAQKEKVRIKLGNDFYPVSLEFAESGQEVFLTVDGIEVRNE